MNLSECLVLKMLKSELVQSLCEAVDHVVVDAVGTVGGGDRRVEDITRAIEDEEEEEIKNLDSVILIHLIFYSLSCILIGRPSV